MIWIGTWTSTGKDNGEMIQEQYSHEMTRFRNRIIVWSSPHELVRISGSFHGSVFESPLCRVHNEHESGSPVTKFGSHERVWNTVTRNRTHEPTRTYTRAFTHAHTSHNTYIHIYTTHCYTHPTSHDMIYPWINFQNSWRINLHWLYWRQVHI